MSAAERPTTHDAGADTSAGAGVGARAGRGGDRHSGDAGSVTSTRLDRLTLVGMGLGVVLLIQPVWADGFRLGFFLTLVATAGQIAVAHGWGSGAAPAADDGHAGADGCAGAGRSPADGVDPTGGGLRS